MKTVEEKRAYQAAWRAKNPEKVRASREARREKKRLADREYYAANPEKMKAYREANREKRKAQSRAWYAANREHALQYAKTYYETNHDVIQQREKAAYDADPEKYRAYARKWREKNPEKVREMSKNRDPLKSRSAVKKWQKANPDKVRIISLRNRPKRNASRREKRRLFPDLVHAIDKAWRAKYSQENPEKNTEWCSRRRAQILNAAVNDLTAAQWKAIKTHYGFRCVYCGKKPKRLTIDHIIPLSKGGNHTFSNVVPACRSCNSRKKAGPVLIPVQPLLFALS